MEENNTSAAVTTQTPEPAQPVNQTPVKPVKVNNFLVLLLSVLLLFAVVIAGFFYFQTQKLSKELTKYQAQASPTPTTIPDPTVSWKTYTNSDEGFSIKYPNTWSDPTKSLLSTRSSYSFVPDNLNITVGFYYDQALQRPRTYDEEVSAQEKSAVGKKNIVIENADKTIYVNTIGQSTTEETAIFKGKGQNIIWITMSFPPGTDRSSFLRAPRAISGLKKALNYC